MDRVDPCPLLDSFQGENAGSFMGDGLQVSGQCCCRGDRQDGCHQLASNSRAQSPHQASSTPSIDLRGGIILIFIFLESNLVDRREIVLVAVQASGSTEGELSDQSRLLRHMLKSFTGISLKAPCLSETYF